MPVHRVMIDDDLELEVRKIELHEKIVSTFAHGNCMVVVTEPKDPTRTPGRGKETRA